MTTRIYTVSDAWEDAARWMENYRRDHPEDQHTDCDIFLSDESRSESPYWPARARQCGPGESALVTDIREAWLQHRAAIDAVLPVDFAPICYTFFALVTASSI